MAMSEQITAIENLVYRLVSDVCFFVPKKQKKVSQLVKGVYIRLTVVHTVELQWLDWLVS